MPCSLCLALYCLGHKSNDCVFGFGEIMNICTCMSYSVQSIPSIILFFRFFLSKTLRNYTMKFNDFTIMSNNFVIINCIDNLNACFVSPFLVNTLEE